MIFSDHLCNLAVIWSMAILCFDFQDQGCLVQDWSPILISQALIWGSWSETQWMIKLSSLKSKVAWVWSASPCDVWLTGSRLLVLMLVTCVINQSGWSDVQWMLKSLVWCAQVVVQAWVWSVGHWHCVLWLAGLWGQARQEGHARGCWLETHQNYHH